MTLPRYTISLLLLSLIVGHTLAQQIDCPVLENAAFAETRLWCSTLTSGQICYGNAPVEARLIEPDMPFQQAGQFAQLAAITHLSTQATPNQYGVTLAQIQPYPAESWEASTATMLVFGETSLINQGNEYAELSVLSLVVTDVGAANVRSQPSPNASSIGAVRTNDTIKATGRLASNRWLRLQMPDGRTGWLAASVISSDFSGLPVVTPDETAPAPFYRPFSAFTLITPLDDARCPIVPSSGVLIQTPRADRSAPDARYKLRVNSVEIAMEGTIFLQAAPEREMRVSVLEGQAEVSALEGRVDAQAGEHVILRLGPLTDETLAPAGPPLAAVPYAYPRLLSLPLALLPRPTYVGFDVRAALIRPVPADGNSPLTNVLVTDPCQISIAADGVNVRTGAGREFPVRAVLNFRESGTPIARAQGTDGNIWWQLAQDVWISSETVVTGGACLAVPLVDAPRPPNP